MMPHRRVPAAHAAPALAVLAALPVLAGAATAEAQIVTGWVRDAATDSVVVGAEVVLLDSAGTPLRMSLTAEDGRFLLLAPLPGRYGVRASALGYAEMVADTVSVDDSESVFVELWLATRPVALPPLHVVARDRGLRQRWLRDHYRRMERRADEHGWMMFPRVELARWDGWTFESFIRSFTPPIGRPGCAPAVYWDGWQRSPDAELPVSGIEGIEFHRGYGPIDTPFSNPAGCGVILVWTRPHDADDAFTADRAFLAAGVLGLMLLMTLSFR